MAWCSSASSAGSVESEWVGGRRCVKCKWGRGRGRGERRREVWVGLRAPMIYNEPLNVPAVDMDTVAAADEGMVMERWVVAGTRLPAYSMLTSLSLVVG